MRAASPSLAIGFIVSGTLLLTSQDAISKWLVQSFHVGEVMFWRGLLALPAVAVLLWWEGGLGLMRARRPGANLLRAALAVVTGVLVVLTFRHLPLATGLALIFVNPLLLTALSVPLLGERVGPRRWAAVLAGFAGVLVITRPGLDGSQGAGVGWAVLIPLAAALTAALRDIVTRRLGGHEAPVAVLAYSILLAAACGALSLPLVWTAAPDLAELGLYLAAGTLLALSYWLTIKAFHAAEAALVSPFKYLALVWAALLGYLVWGDVPDAPTVAGALLVAASSLYVARRERLAALATGSVGRAGRPASELRSGARPTRSPTQPPKE